MKFYVEDFAGAAEFFDGDGFQEWRELESVLEASSVHLQPSDQAGLHRKPIFDPKATNRELTERAGKLGWRAIPVPEELQMFGKDWDAGKRTTLVEWQFSNYPFLWNNIIRTQGVYRSHLNLEGMQGVESLLIVTKSGQFPASNSTLYFEQARSQIKTVMDYLEFTIPIRLIGIALEQNSSQLEAVWNTYAGARYDRVPSTSQKREFDIVWSTRKSKYGNPSATFSLK